MARTETEELVEDAMLDDLPEQSRIGGFFRGALLGLVASGAVALVLTFTTPLPDNLPGVGSVRVEGAGVSVEASSEPTKPADEEPVPVANQTESSASSTRAEAGDDAGAVGVTTVEPETQSSSGVTGSETATPADLVTQTEPLEDESGAESGTATSGVPQLQSADTAPSEDPDDQDSTDGQEEEIAAVTSSEPATPESVETVPELALSGPAIDVNARPFDAPDTAPLLAVVLDDAGNGTVEADALSLLTMPLTLSIRPDGAASTALAETARSSNHEVLVRLPLALPDQAPVKGVLHEGLTGQELSDLTERYFARMPVAVGATPGDASALLRNREAMRAITRPLEAHGFVWVDQSPGNGSSVPEIASESGFGFAETGRVVDAGATGEQIFNGLESAAFQARQRGTAIVRIPASRDALTALLRWGLERDRRPVWFAPVSAVLKRRAERQ
ncbi:MAG: divergent polysaccharide deacetylase family protein [Pseudomonadota bacterium]